MTASPRRSLASAAVTGRPERLDDATALLHGRTGDDSLPLPSAEARAQLRKLIELNDGPAIALFLQAIQRPGDWPEVAV